MSLLAAILKRDILLAFRRGGGAWSGLGFFLLALVLLGFGLGPELFRHHLASIVCVSALLSLQLSLSGMLENDFEDGCMEQYLLMPVALELVVFAKMLSAWVAGALPLLILAPLVMAGAGDASPMAMLLALLLAVPSLIALGIFSGALTISMKRAGLVQMLISLPLTIPVLIFAAAGAGGAEGFTTLAGIALAMVPLSCLASAALVRMAHE